MTRFAKTMLTVGIALLGTAVGAVQHEMIVAGAHYTLPDDRRPVRHQTAAVLESADGAVRYPLLPGFNDFGDSEVDPALRREATEWVDREGGWEVERSEP